MTNLNQLHAYIENMRDQIDNKVDVIYEYLYHLQYKIEECEEIDDETWRDCEQLVNNIYFTLAKLKEL
jgi:hypothetical protein